MIVGGIVLESYLLLFTASRGQEWGRGVAEGVEEEVKAAEGSLFASADYGGQNALASGTKPGAIATPDFAVHDGRTNGLFATIIRGVDRGIDQKPKPVHRMLQQVPGQTPIRRVRETALSQLLQFTGQAQAALGQVIAEHRP